MVHASVPPGSPDPARHLVFIAGHLAGGVAALGLLAPALALSGPRFAFAAIALALLGLQALAALYVSATGRLGLGAAAAAGLFSAFVAWMAIHTGGLSSFALAWFVVVPLEAALFAGRRVIVGAVSAALAGLVAVALIAGEGNPAPGAASLLASLLAVGYGGWLAARVGRAQRRERSAAQALQERYRLLADTVRDVVTCHDASGDVTFASPASATLCGVPPHRAMGAGLQRLIHVADRPAFLTALSGALHDGSSEVEYRLKRGGEDAAGFVWVETVFRRDPGLGAAVVVGVTRDITRRKEQAEELTRARREADAANAAKTRFLANMSHELRTPLNAIIGFSDMLRTESVGALANERQQEYVRLIHESGEHLLNVVRDILDMSKIEAGSFDILPEPFDAAATVDACLRLMSQQAEARGVRLRRRLPADLPELTADRRALKQILLNLLSNAVKFTEAGGEVMCGARAEGQELVVFVRDTGVGIAEGDLPRIGLPFVQAESGYDRRHEGTGLGLSVVKGLAALHGGSVAIDSRLGRGTEVTVRLPLLPTAARPPVAAAASAWAADGREADVTPVDLGAARAAKRA